MITLITSMPSNFPCKEGTSAAINFADIAFKLFKQRP